MITLPYEPLFLTHKINIHLICEYFAFFGGYRYYAYLRKKSNDTISLENRINTLLGAVVGAFIGSRFCAFMEHPVLDITAIKFLQLINLKTIMGGLFGGLLGVEYVKKRIGEKKSTGDLYVLPLILGIFIGRIGCFLSGINEYTYGVTTTFFMGMNLGDGVLRHPLALYELFFLALLFLFSLFLKNRLNKSGDLFKQFMIMYFLFRFFIEFLKPNQFFIVGLSSIQWLCIVCFIYYAKYILKIIKNASKKLYLLRLHT